MTRSKFAKIEECGGLLVQYAHGAALKRIWRSLYSPRIAPGQFATEIRALGAASVYVALITRKSTSELPRAHLALCALCKVAGEVTMITDWVADVEKGVWATL